MSSHSRYNQDRAPSRSRSQSRGRHQGDRYNDRQDRGGYSDRSARADRGGYPDRGDRYDDRSRGDRSDRYDDRSRGDRYADRSDRYDDRSRGDRYDDRSRGDRHAPRGDRYDDRDRDRGRDHSERSAAASGKWAAAAQAAESGSTGYRNWETVDDEPEDYNSSEWLTRKTKKVQDDSLQSSRRALQRLREAEQVAEQNLSTIDMQGEQLDRIERRLDETADVAKIADSKATHLQALNRFFLIPTFGLGKKTKQREDQLKSEQEERITQEESRRQDRDAARQDRDRMRREQMERTYQRGDSDRSYSTPSGWDRDEKEEEIDDNLDQMSSGLARLRMMATTMGDELTSQTDKLVRVQDKTDQLNDRVTNTTRKVEGMLDKKKGRK
ncbi:uncharacterized protein BJ171DRAFT_419901 [Polychytrium aggregatum]|uniref:uncharacterized protein n=1 Tax=Polychytrium aggregatum TaxID=110093 RepID=UPI0022FE2AC3|nr:uncharacterized protein BJ171DRAFT_419901 [Polychytrium aggregatum]KAI9208197.1 hypothetical protein BJ171DRAFT_419901 [Polychytrium aggregatum]